MRGEWKAMPAKKSSAKASGAKKTMRPVPKKMKAKATKASMSKKRGGARGVPARGGSMGRGKKTNY